MTYRDAIKAARDRYNESMDAAAADVLLIVQEHGRPRTTVCKDIAGEGWNALDHRARKLEKTAGQSMDELRRARDKENRRVEESKARAFAKRDPEAAARMVAKVNPDVLIEAASEALGQTRSTSPSNKAKVEQAFGPEEFNRLEYAIEGVLERLPDLAPNKDDKTYANELADKAETVAAILRDWAKGQDIGQEVEAWLEAK